MSERNTLSDAKRALLERRLRGRADDVDEFMRRPGRPPTLSPGQRRLWFLHQVAPESAAYTMFDARRIIGPLDGPALESALAAIVDRHEILRTVYPTRDGRPSPEVRPDAIVSLSRIRLADGSSTESGLASETSAFVRRPFDLETGPVFRAALIEYAPERAVLVLAVHHIACDEWSLDLLWHEISEHYAATLEGRIPDLPVPRLQYADYAAWQNDRIDAGEARTHIEYWKRTLTPSPPPLELITDRLPPIRRSFAGGIASADVDAATSRGLAAIASGAGVTPFVVGLAAFAVLLHHTTGEAEVVIGVPVTGRSRRAFEPVIGFFLNSLPIRVDLGGAPTFLELLARVQAVFLDALTHQDAPFESIVEAVATDRTLNRNPIFQVMFVEQGSPARLSLPGTRTEPFAITSGASKFDLTLFASGRHDDSRLMLEYDADRFVAATAERLLEQHRTLLQAIAAEPNASIDTLPLSSPQELRQIRQWSIGPPLDASTLEPVHVQIWRIAAARPDDVAIASAAGSLTYRALCENAQGLAARLKARGIGNGDRVGVLAERSPDMIVAILGVMQAGAAYVPLDPAYPHARLEFALRDSGARVIVTTTLLEADTERLGLDVMIIGEPSPSANYATPDATLDDVAYVLHTSGSTGVPKGVAVTHRNLASSTLARASVYPDAPGVFLLLPSFAFDSSVAGIFWTLTIGGTLALPPGRIEQDVEALARFVALHRVTHTLCLPTLWEAVLENAPLDALASLHTVIVAGEACRPGLVARHYEALPAVGLWNEYGPTEATVWSTGCLIPSDFSGPRVPIGTPIPGTFVRVLTVGDGPAAVGIPGELCIGGAGVTGGYLNRPDETTRRFFRDAEDALLYRTGDRVRWSHDGQLEFLGRVDRQIKIRGFRIEPGEIENALRGHAAVRDCAVLARRPSTTTTADPEDLVSALARLDAGVAEQLVDVVEAMDAMEGVL